MKSVGNRLYAKLYEEQVIIENRKSFVRKQIALIAKHISENLNPWYDFSFDDFFSSHFTIP